MSAQCTCLLQLSTRLEGEPFSYATANSQDGTTLDIVASGFWSGTFERSFYDVRVFNPHPPSNQNPQMEYTYRCHKALKQCTYEQRVREVEHASFTPLVMSLTGSLGTAASIYHLQVSGFLPFWQVGPTVQPYDGLVEVSPLFLPAAVVHNVHQRCPLL